jgi:hypothetical protein
MMLRLIPLLVLLLSMSLSARGVEIIARGGSQVVIFDADQPESENPKLTWSWDVKGATNLPGSSAGSAVVFREFTFN